MNDESVSLDDILAELRVQLLIAVKDGNEHRAHTLSMIYATLTH